MSLPTQYSPNRPHTSVATLLLVAALAVLALAPGAPAVAQNRTVENVANDFVKAHVTTQSRAGRFWITAGRRYLDSIKFLYATNPSFVTSNLVFRISRGTEVNYYCNHPKGYLPWQPTAIDGTEAVFKPYDTMIVRQDTLTMEWRGMSGYDVTMRFIAEKPSTIYDTGGDLLIEFSYRLAPFAPSAELGILLMLDTFNSQGGSYDGGGMGDQPSVMTSNGYLPVNAPSNNVRFTGNGVPEWYHVGNFLWLSPLNDVFPVHRLSGRSHGGAELTTPNVLAIGNWYMLRSVAWDLPGAFSSSGFGDCATIVRWESLAGEGTVRTAFGLNDKGGNNLFTCRDDNLFVDIRAPRLITQAVKNGPFSIEEFDVEMWASNLSQTTPVNPIIRLQTPINSYPSYPAIGNRLLLDASTPDAQQVYIPPKGTVKLRWRLRVNPLSRDTLAQLVFFAKYGLQRERRFLEDCSPLITVRGWQEPPPPPDTLAPRIELLDQRRDSTMHWTFRLYDRHPGYQWDLGMSSPIELVASDNMSVRFTPSIFPSCDTTQTVTMVAEVTDTSRNASATIRAVDCAGNDSIATIVFAPRPDIFPPEHLTRMSGGLGDCNSRHYEITLIDSTHQTPTAGDHGFGAVVVMLADNFTVTVNGGQPILPFQKSVSVVADVIDSMRNGGFALRVFDYAGNEVTLPYGYCTRSDTKAPEALVIGNGPGQYLVTVSDRRAWDRGLRRIDVVSNRGNNMRITQPPAITIGDLDAFFPVEAIDLTLPGELVLDVFDSVYTIVSDPENHVTRVVIRYEPGVEPEDTIAPDITFAPVAGSNGATATVSVDEIHFVGGMRYPNDTGLNDVWVESATPNIRLNSVISFSKGDTITSFQIQVIDTLAIGTRDTIIITATDLAGNLNRASYIYPIVPDTLVPIFIGAMDPARTAIEATVTDARLYDRGLGSIELESASNLALVGLPADIAGRSSSVVRFDVTDPDAPVSGTIVLRDLVGLDRSFENAGEHVVRIPFSLPSVAIEVAMPETVEGGEPVVAALVARTAIGSDVDSISLAIRYAGAEGAPVPRWLVQGNVSLEQSAGLMRVSITPSARLSPGDTIGTLTFATSMTGFVYDLSVAIADATVNGGLGSEIVVASLAADTARSVLRLPPPLMRVTGDSVAWVNGDCDRILTGRRPASKPNALAILGVRPQPIVGSGGAPLELDLRNLPRDGAVAELVAVDGTVVATSAIDGAEDPIARRLVRFTGVAQGTYVLRLVATSGVDHTLVVVVE